MNEYYLQVYKQYQGILTLRSSRPRHSHFFILMGSTFLPACFLGFKELKIWWSKFDNQTAK